MQIGDYPPGVTSSTHNAPWNIVENEDIRFNCTASQTLSKDTWVYTRNYMFDDGSFVPTDSCNAEGEYSEQHYTPLELVNILKALLKKIKDDGSVEWKDYYEEIIEECDGWIEDEFVCNV